MGMEMQESVNLFPEHEQLKEDVENLRAEISWAILKRNGLQLLEAQEIQMKHLLKLGTTEYRMQATKCTMLRLGRKAEILAELQKRDETLSPKKVEELLDREFEEYRKILEDQRIAIHEAFTRNKGKWILRQNLSLLNERYYKIIKALHPDLHLNSEMVQLELYHQAAVAYENEDLVTLCLIAEMVTALMECGSEDAWSRLREEKVRLERLLKQVNREIVLIEGNYPFTVKELIQDEEKIRKRKKELQDITARYEENIRRYQEKIRVLSGSSNVF